MFEGLTKKQKEILNCPAVRSVVKACPGSGKTFSVAARLARLLNEQTYRHQGIAVISFTNVAAQEIKKSLEENYSIADVGYPHFIGTIDSFINQHIFLPFGHLVMGCSERPEIVGTEYNPWFAYDFTNINFYTKKNQDPDFYFDKVSFNSQDDPIPLKPYNIYPVTKDNWLNRYTAKGDLRKFFKDIIASKREIFEQGKANQSDANYFALKILQKYPSILSSLANKYCHLIIDEAQDTTDVQMKIFDALSDAGLENLMFVGDPEQAIFEWNTADANLFKSKYQNPAFNKIDLNENRRSSQKICTVLNYMINDESTSIADCKADDNDPTVVGYDSSKNQSVLDLKTRFIQKCEEQGIPSENTAILFRGKKFGETHFQLAKSGPEEQPWQNKMFYVRDIVHGKYLVDTGNFKDGLKLLEKGYHRLINPHLNYISKTFLASQITNLGFKEYRRTLFNFINLLPFTIDVFLADWINEANRHLGRMGYPKIAVKKGIFKIEDLFHKSETSVYPFTLGTIHSVKGQTFDAVLLFVIKKAGQSHYVNIFGKDDLSSRQKEELRLIYVACSRPKRFLWVAVPTEDQEAWNKYLGLGKVKANEKN